MDRKTKVRFAKKVAIRTATVIMLGIVSYLERRMVAEEEEEQKEKDIIVIKGEIVED